ncbi:hypothetical protein PV11_04547 [Exophiala sideris]|uniref:Uncharacterized protein n=1 Tax=Exophiala sideris TaxID=1016849 RepID=A0A0D1YHV9_9EURO|nr:hypothetical protein PV11_04547 [Exophiala sideris]
MSTDDQAQTTLLDALDAAGFPYFTTFLQTHYDLLDTISAAQDRIDAGCARVEPMLCGGRNVDAVDELAKYHFYYGQLVDAWEWCVEMLHRTDCVINMMDGIAFVNDVVRDEHLEDLSDLEVFIEIWEEWRVDEAHVLAIISLSQKLFE